MNYLKQINEFNLRRKLYPIPGTAIALYIVLLDRFNQARFPHSMPVSTGFLASELRVSTTTVRNSREELVKSGFIGCTARGKSSIYSIIELGGENSCSNINNQPGCAEASDAPRCGGKQEIAGA